MTNLKIRLFFQANARRYQQSLQPIKRLVSQLKRGSHGKLVNTSEPVFDYALTAMGYKINNNHFAQAVQNDTDPSPKDIQQMDHDIKTHKIAFFCLKCARNQRNYGRYRQTVPAFWHPRFKGD
ncbi:metal ABC transporter solute-binding protein, Zn/Mn family [Secundilactobacillus kimchicus]|uniref:metal ABC transporter solute-binding protein, Zn/Mn family n=1 Tax=Secundilactobacillus kimchicus TaxID=528209 RepID=UPI0034E572DE